MRPLMSPRAAKVLAMMRYPSTPVSGYDPAYAFGCVYRDPRDPQWFKLCGIPNVGPKTIRDMTAEGLIEERPRPHWVSYWDRWYRLPFYRRADYEEDFGDLWVA